MKSQLEYEDIKAMASEVAEMLRPMLKDMTYKGLLNRCMPVKPLFIGLHKGM